MSFTTHPVETTSWRFNPKRQYLKGFGGPLVTASEVRVYKAKTMRLIRIEDVNGNPIKRGAK